MREVRLHWELFRGGTASKQLSEYVMAQLLAAQTLLNVAYLVAHPDTPPLYESGLCWASEGPYNEEWKTIPVCLAGDVLDCEDAACWRAAELIVAAHFDIEALRHGADAAARPAFRSRSIGRGRRMYHVLVARGDGTVEDPSRVLGMGTRKGRRMPL